MGSAREPVRGPETVLLVEDEVLVRMLGVDLLEEAGYRVIEAANADVALKVLEADPDAISILFTDVHMPGSMDGQGLARIVDQRWPWIRIIITSGRAHLSSEDVPDHGRFVPKPWVIDAMMKAIRSSGQIG
jgi:two-component system, response regulator PdtaR